MVLYGLFNFILESMKLQYYNTNSDESKGFASSYRKLGKITKGIVKVGAVNCDRDRNAKKKYKIQQSPTVKIFASINI